MGILRLSVILIVFAIATASLAQDKAVSPSETTSNYTLSLHFGKVIPLSEDATHSLYKMTIDFLASSNFNSSIPEWRDRWGIPTIQEHYRQTVAGKYLLITYKQPQKIQTVGGEVSVLEIVVGLNGERGASPLFTIDDEGRIVSHSFFNGPLGIDFLELVKKIANNP